MTRRHRLTSPAGYALVAVLVGLLFVAGYFGGRFLFARSAAPPAASAPAGAGIVSPPKPLSDFTLTSHTGDALSLSDLRGRAVLMFFGYTHCPDECPTTLANFKRVKSSLGELADQVAFLFVSVDGRRDTPEVVNEYLARFDPAFIGMTGDDDALERVGAEYGLYTEIYNAQGTPIPEEEHDAHHHADSDETAPDNDNYFVGHTSPSFLIDPQGNLRMIYFYGAHPDAMVEGIRLLLQG